MKMVINNKIKRRKNIINEIGLSLLFLIMIGCQNPNHKNAEYSFQNIEEKIETLINSDNPEVIDMTRLTPINWSELYIFKPYTPIDDINNELGFNWKEAEKTHINQDDNFNLLVFVKKNKVINYIKWPRQKGDFMRVENIKHSYSSANFILKKEKYGDQDWVFLYKK